MANPEHMAALRKGVFCWNQWRLKNPSVSPDLSEADLSGLDLRSVNFGRHTHVKNAFESLSASQEETEYTIHVHGVDLTSARLAGADLRWSTFRFAKLVTADLAGANLNDADLSHAALDGACLSRANLVGVNLTGAKLSRAELSDVQMGYTILADLDLSDVCGIETIFCHGPCSIGVDTILQSGGRIPEAFLRDAGTPEQFIAYARSLVGQPIQFYSCFISYSTEDQDFSDRVHADLQRNGVRCWFAPHDVQGGKKLHDQIDEAIRLYDRLLLILSDHSMTSEWVKTEIAHARQKELGQKRQVLFPISLVPFDRIREWKCFDADAGKDSAREIREYFIPDFSNWKDHDSYEKAFERLVRDLNVDQLRTKRR